MNMRKTFVRALVRLDQGSLASLLAAPCIWCDYNGAAYWQSRSHDVECPWNEVASSQARLEVLAHGPEMATDKARNLRELWKRIEADDSDEDHATLSVRGEDLR